MLDTVREVHTPEGVALRLPAAGPVPRALAWLIDLAIRMALLMAISMVLGMLGAFGNGVYLILLFVVFWAYPVVFEAMYGGQTPGKRALGLRVVSADGAPIGWMASFVRNLMRTVDMLPFGYGAGLVASLADPWSRRLGDTVAGTLVIHACTIEDAVLIGMGALVLDGVVVRKHAFIAAGAVVTPGKVVGERELWVGNPARCVRTLDDAQIEGLYYSAAHYVRLKDEYLAAVAG